MGALEQKGFKSDRTGPMESVVSPDHTLQIPEVSWTWLPGDPQLASHTCGKGLGRNPRDGPILLDPNIAYLGCERQTWIRERIKSAFLSSTPPGSSFTDVSHGSGIVSLDFWASLQKRSPVLKGEPKF